MTAANFKIKVQQAASGTDSYYEAQSTTITTKLMSTGVVASSTNYIAIIEGHCEPSAGGTLQLRVETEVNASNVIIANTGAGYAIDCG
jgi:hypothetical protein